MNIQFYIFILSIFLTKVLCADICDGSDGCVFATKTKMMIPMIDAIGNANPRAEAFDWKIMKVYPDKIQFFKTLQDQYFDRDAFPGDLIREILFSQIILNCGADGNLICNAGELGKLAPHFEMPAVIQSQIDGWQRRCFALPVIDSVKRPLGETCVYICYPFQMFRNIYMDKSKISRSIDLYQIASIKEEQSASNGIIRTAANFKHLNAEKKWVSSRIALFFHYLVAYENPTLFTSKILQIPLNVIDHKKGVQTIKTALSKQFYEENQWLAFVDEHQIQDPNANLCCLYIPLKEQLSPDDEDLFKILCVYLTPEQISEKQTCKSIALIWVQYLNAFSNRLHLTKDQKFFTRKKNQDGLSCKKDQISESFKIFFKRLVNIVAYEDDVCTDLKILSDMSAGECLKSKTDQISLETQAIAEGNQEVMKLIDDCIKYGDLPLGVDATAG